jgi:hypothetical protein
MTEAIVRRWDAIVFTAVFVALRAEPELAVCENLCYLKDLMGHKTELLTEGD